MNFDGESPMANWRRQNGRDKPFGLKYFGVGNENWGCGGRMRAEHYADLYRNYSTYARNYGEHRLYRVAAGVRGANYHWTEVLMREAGCLMDGLAVHYYTHVGDKVIVQKMPAGNEVYLRDEPISRHSATEFDEADWFGIMRAACFTDELMKKHCQIMDKYDPDKRVAMIVDEWGTWFDSEPGTNPGFLYQQNTLRDAVSAAIALNICFNGEAIPGLSASASRSKDGKLLLTLANPDPNDALDVVVNLGVELFRGASARIITSESMDDHNDFTDGEKVRPRPFDGAKLEQGRLSVRLPQKCVAAIELR